MSKTFNDPSLLTKDRLKKELESSGIKLPRGDQKKEVYVKLYRENLSPRSGQQSGQGEFSSDDDDFGHSPQSKQIVPRGSRSIRKMASKDIVSADIKSMTDDELKEELASLGSPAGPIMATTRVFYERKLARMREKLPNNGTTVITRSEFSDDNEFDEEEVHEEESAPDDEEFFRKRYERNRGTGGNFGSSFTKNIHDTSTKKEVSRDFNVSSSRNVERSSTFDRKTMNKVRTKKGDKFEENNWSTSASNENGQEEDDEEDVLQKLPGLPSRFQRAITAARFSPEVERPPLATEVRARPSQKQKSEIPEDIPERQTEEKPKTAKKKTAKCRWVLVIAVLILIIFAAAVVYNFEKLPEMNKQYLSLTENNSNAIKS